MKKNFLLFALMLLSFVSAWADDPAPVYHNVNAVPAADGYTVKLTDELVLLNNEGVATAPQLAPSNLFPVVKAGFTFTEVKPDGVYDYSGKKVDVLRKVGYYLLKVTFTEMSTTDEHATPKAGATYVPFTVGKIVPNWTIIYNQKTWEASLEEGFLKSYYEDKPHFELWDTDTKAFAEFDDTPENKATALAGLESGKYVHNYEAQLASMANQGRGAQPFPYFGFTYNEADPIKVVCYIPGNPVKTASWSTRTYGTGNYTRSFNSMAAEDPLIRRMMGMEAAPTDEDKYSKANPFTPFMVKLDMRATTPGPNNTQVTNEHYGDPFKAKEDGSGWYDENTEQPKYASSFADAIRDKDILAEMQLVAVPSTEAPVPAFLITKKDITLVFDAENPSIDHFVYDGNPHTPEFVIEVNGVKLVKDNDFTVVPEVEERYAPGTYTVTIKGKGMYTTGKTTDAEPQERGIVLSYVIESKRESATGYELDADNVTYWGTKTYAKALQKALLTKNGVIQDIIHPQGEAYVPKFVYLGDDVTKLANEADISIAAEVDNPNHVGFWAMRLYITNDDLVSDDYTLYYVTDNFEVTRAIMTLGLLTIDMSYGQDYPEIGDHYSVASGEDEGYKPGDGRDNVEIREFGNAQPLQSYTQFPEAGTTFFYSYTKNPIAVTTIDGVEYQNYNVQVANNQAIIRVGKGNLQIAVVEEDMSKVYGEEDPEFAAVIKNTANKFVKEYSGSETLNECIAAGVVQTYIADNYTLEDAAAFTEEEIATIAEGIPAEEVTQITAEIREAVTREFNEMVRVNGYITVTRDGGVGSTPRKEDVGKYDFTITVAKALSDNYSYTTSAGKFTITPYDITPVEEVKENGKVIVAADPKNDFVIEVDNTEYNGEAQKQLPRVKFYHKALKQWINLTEGSADNPETTDVNEFVAPDYNLSWSGELTQVTRAENTRDAVQASIVTVDAGESITDAEKDFDKGPINPNFIGQKSAKYAILAKTLTITFASDWKKIYGDLDPANILNPTYAGLVDGDAVTAPGFWITQPQFSREQGEEVGTYKIFAVKNQTTQQTVGTTRNYDLTSNEGKLTIVKDTLIVTAEPYILDEDGDPDFESPITFGDDIYFHVTVEGYNSQTAGTTELVMEDKNLLREEDEDVKAGVAPKIALYGKINVDGNDAGTFSWSFNNENGMPELKNYYVKYKGNQGRINADGDGLWIIAKNASKTYGTADKPEYFDYFATLDGELIDLKTIGATDDDLAHIVVTRDKTRSNAGTYPLFFQQVFTDEGTRPTQIGNYLVNYMDGYYVDAETGDPSEYGWFTIEKAHLLAKVKDQTIQYGQQPVFDIEEYKPENGSSGLVAGDDFDNVVNQALQELGYKSVRQYLAANNKYDCSYSTDPAVQDYQVTVKKEWPEALNYVIAFNPGNLTVEKAELTISALPQTIRYIQDLTDDANKVYTTPAINDEIIPGTTVAVTGVVPEGVDIEGLVELSCDVTAVGTHEGAIKISKKASATCAVNITDAEGNVLNGDLTITPLKDIHLSYENVAQALEDHKGVTMEKVYMPNRKMKADQWYTFVLPFEVSVPEIARTFYYGVVDVLNENANDGDFHFDLTINNVEANQPFLFKVAEDPAYPAKNNDGYAVTENRMETIYFEGKKIADVEEGGVFFAYNDFEKSPFRADAAGNKIIGQYTGVALKSLTELDHYMVNGEFRLPNPESTASLKPTVAYISSPSKEAAADVRIFVQEADGTTTDISGVDAEADAEFAEGWYTVTGVKLDAKPTEKGIYIYNGKKVSIQ